MVGEGGKEAGREEGKGLGQAEYIKHWAVVKIQHFNTSMWKAPPGAL